jgi:hypothetical protein
VRTSGVDLGSSRGARRDGGGNLASGRRKRGGEAARQGTDLRLSKGAWSGQLLGCRFRPQHVQTVDRERAPDQPPVAVDEAEHAQQWRLVRFARSESGPDHNVAQMLDSSGGTSRGTWHYPEGGPPDATEDIAYTRVDDNG